MTPSRFNKWWFNLQNSKKLFKHQLSIPLQIFIKWWTWAFCYLIYIGDLKTNCPDRSQGVCNQHPYSMLEPAKKSSRKFSKNKELAHSTSLSTPSGSIGWGRKFSARAVTTSALVRELDLLEWNSWNMLQRQEHQQWQWEII